MYRKSFFFGLGVLLGSAVVIRIKELRQGPDEVGSMGVILPDGEDFAGVFLGGLTGVAFYNALRFLWQVPTPQLKRGFAAIFVATLFVVLGILVGAQVGRASMLSGTGAALGGAIGLVAGIVFLLRRQTRESRRGCDTDEAMQRRRKP